MNSLVKLREKIWVCYGFCKQEKVLERWKWKNGRMTHFDLKGVSEDRKAKEGVDCVINNKYKIFLSKWISETERIH